MNIQIKNLSFAYNEDAVLENVSFSATSGEFLCMLGRNGVGKSTLFRCILGLLKGYSGEILLDGRNVKDMNSREMARSIAYIPQTHTPSFNYSVLCITMMGMTACMGKCASPNIQQEKAARNALKELGILHLADRGYAEISGGERQLVLIARALVQKSKVLIFDEPTANLDYGNQIRVMRHIRALARQGYLVILSTHNPEHARDYGNRVLVLKDGRIFMIGHPEKVLNVETIEHIYGVELDARQQLSYAHC